MTHDIQRLLAEFFPAVFPLLLFLQGQWLSFLAGMVWGRTSEDSARSTFRRWLLIASLLTLQTTGCCFLISQMYCGQFENTVLQGLGGFCLFSLGVFTSRHLVASLALRYLMLVAIGGGIILSIWQMALASDSISMEKLMMFTLPLLAGTTIATSIKLGILFCETVLQRPSWAGHRYLSSILIVMAHLLFTTLATFGTALAFDCGI